RDRVVLPARFGTTFQDEAKLRAALNAHERDLAAGLKRLSGCVELGVRVLWEQPPAAGAAPAPESESASAPVEPPPDSGQAYMMARLAQERRLQDQLERAERVAEEIHAPVAPLAVDSTGRLMTTPQLL